MNLDKILPLVEKPARYTGGELNSVLKENAEVNFVFSYPDTYEMGMSHLGGKIIYHTLNQREDTFCQRAYAPWIDMEAQMRLHDIPLFTLENKMPVKDADIWGITLQYELSYSNIINMLDLAKVPIFSKDRDENYPLVVAGGPCANHAEMLADFIDCFMLGDGEDTLHEIVDIYKQWKKSKKDKKHLLELLSQNEGFYVPSFYEHKTENGKLTITPINNAPAKVKRRIVTDFENAFIPTKPIVPYIEVVHDRIMLEIFRGCTRGCRFCQAGFLYRPSRERSVERIVAAARESADTTGYDEISLTSLSSGDYSELDRLVKELNGCFACEHMDVSLPSLRIDSFNPDVISTSMRKTSLTFAPEAGSQRMRNIINKNVSEEDLLRTVRGAFNAGYTSIKLYFMIGLPFETKEDIVGIADLAKKCSDVYREIHGNTKNMRITVSTSVFIPKPFTPFQWICQDDEESVKEKQRLLVDLIKPMRGIEYKYHDSTASMLEVACARGGREMCKVLYSAWKNGAKMDAWNECFDIEAWNKAFEENGLSAEYYARRQYELDETLPWDTVDIGTTKEYLKRELEKAQREETTHDCRQGCTGCGLMHICTKEAK